MKYKFKILAVSLFILFIFIVSECTTPTNEWNLNITVEEGGTVNVEPGQDKYEDGTEVTLTASSETGYIFDHWEGDLTGTDNPATITMDSDKDITAVFIEQSWNLEITIEGEGSVSIDPEQETYENGTEVVLEATANTGYIFSRWEGDLTGTDNPATITMDSDKNISAIFSLDSGSPIFTGVTFTDNFESDELEKTIWGSYYSTAEYPNTYSGETACTISTSDAYEGNSALKFPYPVDLFTPSLAVINVDVPYGGAEMSFYYKNNVYDLDWGNYFAMYDNEESAATHSTATEIFDIADDWTLYTYSLAQGTHEILFHFLVITGEDTSLSYIDNFEITCNNNDTEELTITIPEVHPDFD